MKTQKNHQSQTFNLSKQDQATVIQSFGLPQKHHVKKKNQKYQMQNYFLAVNPPLDPLHDF